MWKLISYKLWVNHFATIPPYLISNEENKKDLMKKNQIRMTVK